MINTHQLVSRVPLLGEQRFVCGLPVGKTERRVPLLGERRFVWSLPVGKTERRIPLLGEQTQKEVLGPLFGRFLVACGLPFSNNPGTVVLL